MATARGLVGKLPAHGDFVRRGQPATVLARIDGWLDAELGGAVAAGIPLDEAVDALDGWRFAFAEPDGGGIIAVSVASADAVGRRFPLIGLADLSGRDFASAERWCAAAAAALAEVRDAGGGADAALAALAAVEVPEPVEGGDVSGWWRAGDAAATGGAALPRGEAFRALLAEAA